MFVLTGIANVRERMLERVFGRCFSKLKKCKYDSFTANRKAFDMSNCMQKASYYGFDGVRMMHSGKLVGNFEKILNKPMLIPPHEYMVLQVNTCHWPTVGTIIDAPKNCVSHWFVIFPPTLGKLASDEVENIKKAKRMPKRPIMVWALHAMPVDAFEARSAELRAATSGYASVIGAGNAENALVVVSVSRAVYVPQTCFLDVSVCQPYRNSSVYLEFLSSFKLPTVKNTIFNQIVLSYGTQNPCPIEPKEISPSLVAVLHEIEQILLESSKMDDRMKFLMGQMNFEPKNIVEASNLVDQIIFATLNELEEMTFYYEQFLCQTNVLHRARLCLSRIRATYILDELGMTPQEVLDMKLDIYNALSTTNSEIFENDTQKNYTKKLSSIPEKVREQVKCHIQRLNPHLTLEYSSNCRYLNFVFSLPWICDTSTVSNITIDIIRAENILNSEHYGLREVKDKILELIAILKLTAKPSLGRVLCLVGPAGTGKTTIAESIAKALDKKFGLISIGSLWEASDLKGHRKSYVGSMPGLLMKTISRLCKSDPVILFDEIDKIHFSSPLLTTLLEILDPVQQPDFTDSWLDLPFDISRILFICTANDLHNIHPALRDRMEVIELHGYFEWEKHKIAKNFLIPKALKISGLNDTQFSMTDSAIKDLIREYDFGNAGLRNLSTLIQYCVDTCGLQMSSTGVNKTFKLTLKNYQKFLPIHQIEKCEKIEFLTLPGCVNALTCDIQQIECVKIKSTCNTGGKLHMTGNLDEMMRESASLAYKFVCEYLVSACAKNQNFFIDFDIFLHYPRGGIEKHGTHACVATAISILSMALCKPVPNNWAFLGELSLTGRVLPICSIESKIQIAQNHKIDSIVLSSENRGHWDELSSTFKCNIKAHFVASFSEIVKLLWGDVAQKPCAQYE